jgi:hypothetical protein
MSTVIIRFIDTIKDILSTYDLAVTSNIPPSNKNNNSTSNLNSPAIFSNSTNTTIKSIINSISNYEICKLLPILY